VADEDKGPLGKLVSAPDTYAPDVLHPIPRACGRMLLGLDSALPPPFVGEDVWNSHELSWLNASGVPRRATLEIRIPCTTPNLVESKSLKLYLNSLSFKRFPDSDTLVDTICKDVASTLGCHAHELSCGGLKPTVLREHSSSSSGSCEFLRHAPLWDDKCPSPWVCVDDEDVGEMPDALLARPEETHLMLESRPDDAEGAASNKRPVVKERLVSHVLRTLCPVTGQPDWGSVLIEYEGQQISRGGLLRYICSLRREVGFHENAVERITLAIYRRCHPRELRVTGRFLRRGGVDINPVRAIKTDAPMGLAINHSRGLQQLYVPGQ